MSSAQNISASVRARLLNIARKENRPFGELLQYYSMERFLYRLSISRHSDRFILKGALMLRAWQSPVIRPTMDIDMLGRTDRSEQNIIRQIQEILSTEVAPDGLAFEPDSIKTEPITEDSDYAGLRIRFCGFLGSARVNIQIDIGFGDALYPEPEKLSLPTVLGDKPPMLLCYSRESAIAEKFEAMIKLGFLNSRMKDFYDIWLLSQQFQFIGKQLAEAVRLTFERRNTMFPEEPDIFATAFAEQKQSQWSAFRKRLQQEHLPLSFAVIISDLKEFLLPLTEAVFAGGEMPGIWNKNRGWGDDSHHPVK